jgi:hypothetical protein
LDLGATLLALPTQAEVRLVLAYSATVLVGARIVETVARKHFARAERHDHRGFDYIEHADHYRCPSGQQLVLHLVDRPRKQAVYRAHPSSCAACSFKPACTPHDDGRRVFRSLASWAETDVGRFHQRLSAVMCGACGVLAAVGLWRWIAEPGAGYLMVVVAVSLLSFVRSND